MEDTMDDRLVAATRRAESLVSSLQQRGIDRRDSSAAEQALASLNDEAVAAIEQDIRAAIEELDMLLNPPQDGKKVSA